MMLKIHDPSRIPHGGAFHVKHHITGQDFSSPSLHAVYFTYRKYDKDNGYPISEPDAIEALMCQQHPTWCSDKTAQTNQALAHIESQTASLTATEIATLLPELTDPTLIGNRIAALTSALGIPTCNGCNARRNWLNRAHEWLRNHA